MSDGEKGILRWMREHLVLLDGGMGTLLQARGLRSGERPETWNLKHPDRVRDAHRAYFDAGSSVVCANTFGANGLHYDEGELREIVGAGVRLVREAAEASDGAQPKFAALDLGPTGRLLEPFGDLPFEDAVRLFRQAVRAGAAAGADLVMIETMNDAQETRAALIAVKEECGLPVFVSNAYGADGKLLTGASPEVMTAVLEGLRADAVGVNCSYGPAFLADTVRRYLAAASVPVLFKPNAGLPRSEGGRTLYDVGPEDFAAETARLVPEGLRIMGGCCGTTPEHIRALRRAVEGLAPVPVPRRERTCAASGSAAVYFDLSPVLIGERINPTGKKRFQQALRDRDMAYVLREAVEQEDAGARALDVNVGMPGVDERTLLPAVVRELEAVTSLPLQLDTADPAAMEAALRCYNGKAIINSVNGREDCMRAMLPLAAKYGGVLVALTLDENGIPDTAEGRLAIAERIASRAAEYGIPRKDLLFDPLTMTVSADGGAAAVTLEALRLIRERLGCGTVLGVSNVSFGLPRREWVNSAFMVMALESGLRGAIMNPKSDGMMAAWNAWCALRGLDESCAGYIRFASTHAPQAIAAAAPREAGTDAGGLAGAIERGLRAEAERRAGEALAAGREAMALIGEEIIPALNRVGEAFEQGRAFLPQLLLSAEAAESAFGVIRGREQREGAADGMPVVLATVRGDVHDIGKNIVRLLMENYGLDVHDLGRDVPAERVLAEVERLRAPLAGLSALMTTTVPAMEETIRLLHARAPYCSVMVGGAVLTGEYAERIGADAYGRDAMAAVRIAQEIQSRVEAKNG